MHWLAAKGAVVYLPIGHSPDVDVVADFGGGLIRVQVKTCTRRNGQCFGVQLATRGGNQSWNGVTKYFDPNRFDYLFALVGDGRRWFIPSTAIESRTAVSLGGPKYSEFELEPGEPIPARPGHADTSLHLPTPRRGSAGAGEPGRSVKSVTTSEWVRFPPPPLPRPAETRTPRRFIGRFERTRISSCHQVTIPRDAYIPAGFEVGDKLHATCTGPGRVVLERIDEGSEKLPFGDAT